MNRPIALIAIAIALTPHSVFAREPLSMLTDMSGTWSVEQRMWPGPTAKAVELPPAVAERALVDGKYVTEVMKPATADGSLPSFQRNAFFTVNPVTRRFEYASLDTRAPQLMTERSARTDGALPINLSGGLFTAPQWGAHRNVRFRYRLQMSEVKADRQTVRLYLTPQTTLARKEFLAFEYVYSKLR